MRIPSFTRAMVGGTTAIVLVVVVVALASRSVVDRSEIGSSGPTPQVEERTVAGLEAVPVVDGAGHYITLEFIGDEIELSYFFTKERYGYAKGERIRPGRISHLTGWTYPDLLELGAGEHTVINRQDQLSKAQRYTLRIDPSSVYCVF